jgi:hypothetical protein
MPPNLNNHNKVGFGLTQNMNQNFPINGKSNVSNTSNNNNQNFMGYNRLQPPIYSQIPPNFAQMTPLVGPYRNFNIK